LCLIVIKFEFSDKFSKNIQISSSRKIRPEKAELFNAAGGRKNRETNTQGKANCQSSQIVVQA